MIGSGQREALSGCRIPTGEVRLLLRWIELAQKVGKTSVTDEGHMRVELGGLGRLAIGISLGDGQLFYCLSSWRRKVFETVH